MSPPSDAKAPYIDTQRINAPLAFEDGQVTKKKRRQPRRNPNVAPISGTIAMKYKETLAIEEVAKRPKRQLRRNPNRATPVDDEIPSHDRDLAKLRNPQKQVVQS